MLRRLLVLLVLAVAWYLFRRFSRGGQSRPTAGRRVPPASRGERMVRDRVCNTYLPESRALVVRAADGEHYYFCSEKCRREFLEGGKDA